VSRIEIFTDGACRGNPGIGGFGAILRQGKHEREISGCEEETTNNRMELMAAIAGLSALKNPSVVRITTDSQYLRRGMLEWMVNWKKNNWRTASKKPVKNKDLWQTLDTLQTTHQIEWCWVKGHSGHRENEQADALANEAIDKYLVNRVDD
jgi:ribonuclease HI